MGSLHKAKSTRARAARSVKSTPKPQRRSPATPNSPSQVPREIAELRSARYRLRLIQSCVQVVARMLAAQNCEMDAEAARVLNAHVIDGLLDPLEAIGFVLGEPSSDDSEEVCYEY